MPLFLTVVGGPFLAAWLFHEVTDANRLSIFVHAFSVGMIANLVDWLLIDELFLGVMRPNWAAPAGANIREIPFEHGPHFSDFLKGTVVFLMLALLPTFAL